jgi:hypothetical protein
MLKTLGVLTALAIFALLPRTVPSSPTPIQIYGVWHCGNDQCGWGNTRDMADFDRKNHWLVDRGDGSPSVNLVVLSFVNPKKLLNLTTDAQTVEGVPIGMTPEILKYFTTRKIRVMLSLGGITYVKDWDEALAANPKQLGLNAARTAQRLGVGIEIDYENDDGPNLDGLQQFIAAYRSVAPYDAAGTNPAARLTIDLAPGDQYLVPLTQRATSDWLTSTHPILDYANAMVPFKQPSMSELQQNWREHVEGRPPIPPLAPAKFTGSLYATSRGHVLPECNDFAHSLPHAASSFVQTIEPHGAGKTKGLLGLMFWAAECSATKSPCTSPPNTCESGIGAGAKAFSIPFPMPPLRQN